MTQKKPQIAQAGTLHVVATPLGNLQDLSPRAISILSTCDLIACEDTRVTQRLLSHFEINVPKLISYRDENEVKQTPRLIEDLLAGKSIGLVSDAGTPTLSDPGFRLIRECQKQQIPVTPIPGPSACITALSISGLPSDKFFFAGFLPPKTSARKKFFEDYKHFPSTIILYESCHRIEKFLNDFIDILGAERYLCVAREMTKLHETIITDKADKVREQVLHRSQKGEFVVLIAPEGFCL